MKILKHILAHFCHFFIVALFAQLFSIGDSEEKKCNVILLVTLLFIFLNKNIFIFKILYLLIWIRILKIKLKLPKINKYPSALQQ